MYESVNNFCNTKRSKRIDEGKTFPLESRWQPLNNVIKSFLQKQYQTIKIQNCKSGINSDHEWAP